MRVRVDTLAGNIIRDEPPIHTHSFSATIEGHAVDWDDRGQHWVFKGQEPELWALLNGLCEASGWRTGTYPGGTMDPAFKLTWQPDVCGGLRNDYPRILGGNKE